MSTLNFSIGILSQGAPKTLHNTLSSYKTNGLLDLTDDVILYCNNITPTDLAIAEEFGITNVMGSEENIGIGAAFTKMFEAFKYEDGLILENDWVLIEDKDVVLQTLLSIQEMQQMGTDFFRLRHIKHPGDPLYTRQYKGREMDSPEHLLDASHWLEKDLSKAYPEQIGLYTSVYGTSFNYGDSHYCNHTNNPFYCRRDFYMHAIAPYSGHGNALEGAIRDHWRSSNYNVAHCIPGLFTHLRLDR